MDRFRPGIGALRSLGREIRTAAGPIDNLFVSEDGQLVLVEAKLWRNPEARREVVGQIIDYARELAAWSYTDLDRAIHGRSQKPIWEHVERPGLAEHRFVDALAETLRTGRFLLLIVGDGIRSETERMVDYLASAPQLQFTLGLVELQLHQLSEDEILVTPFVVTRTSEVTRAIIEVAKSDGSLDVNVTVPTEPTGSARKLSQVRFLEGLSDHGHLPPVVQAVEDFLKRVSADGRLSLSFGSANAVVRLREPSVSALYLEQSGQIWTWQIASFLARVGVETEIGTNYVRRLAEILGVQVNPNDPSRWTTSASIDPLLSRATDVLACLTELADEVAAARNGQANTAS